MLAAAVLETNATLTKLVLGDNYLGPGGTKSLAKALKINTALTNLNLAGNNLGPADAESLATALKTNTALTNLNLRCNNLGPESLTTALKTNTTLTNLDFSSSTLGPAGAESLAKVLETNTTLKNLYLWQGNNDISESVQNIIYNAQGNRIRYLLFKKLEKIYQLPVTDSSFLSFFHFALFVKLTTFFQRKWIFSV